MEVLKASRYSVTYVHEGVQYTRSFLCPLGVDGLKKALEKRGYKVHKIAISQVD